MLPSSDTSPLCGWRLESSKAAPGAEWHRQPNAAGMRVLRAAREERSVRADLCSGIHLPNGEEVAREQLSFSEQEEINVSVLLSSPLFFRNYAALGDSYRKLKVLRTCGNRRL